MVQLKLDLESEVLDLDLSLIHSSIQHYLVFPMCQRLPDARHTKIKMKYPCL